MWPQYVKAKSSIPAILSSFFVALSTRDTGSIVFPGTIAACL